MRIIAFFLAVMLLTGCGKTSVMPKDTWNEKEKEQVHETEKPTRGVALYEPKGTCLTGAYISKDDFTRGSIDVFEEMTEASHDLYAIEICLDEKKIENFMLQCLSREKIPYIIIKPSLSGGKLYDKALLMAMAEAIGSYDMPAFVEVFPVGGAGQFNPREYKDFFSFASNALRDIAPKSAIVWGVDRSFAYIPENYFPGEKYMDWISVEALKDMGDSQERLLDEVQQLSLYFSGVKPIMLRTAVAHFSTNGHKYDTMEAAKNIEGLYIFIKENYPLIKGVVYMDMDISKNAPRCVNRGDYTVTGEIEVLEGYRNAVQCLSQGAVS